MISFVMRRDAQTDMATVIPAFVRLTKLGLHGQQFVSCPPLGEEERKREKVRERVKTCRGQRSQLAVRWEVSAIEFPPSHRHVHRALALSDGIIYQTGDVHHRGRTTGESDLIDWKHRYT